ncbi:MAG: amidase [Deltaproteobacteria bacterium]|nr:amidase [Deltaproteobacteria bacterium]MBW2414257.1 amidase [Deltaproteobacteria bacterium]
MATGLPELDLLEAAAALRAGETSPTELLAATLARIERLEPQLHAYVRVLADSAARQAQRAEQEIARGEARGPLHGVPIAVKDLCATKGVPTASGTTVMADRRPDHDATVVEKLVEAGAVIVGKTMLTEGATGEHHPDLVAPVNPWGPDHWPGVSSSGSGVAVAASLCFGALGSDTGGSIRFPSAACGVTGIKPTYGRVSRYGVFPLAASLDHVGPITRSAADAAALLQVIAGRDPKDPTSLRHVLPDLAREQTRGVRGLRIGVDEAYCTENSDPAVSEAVLAASRVLADLGADLVAVQVPPWLALARGWNTVCGVEAAMAHAATFPSRADEYGPRLHAMLERGLRTTGADYAAVQAESAAFRGRLGETFESVDLLLCPSMPMPAPPLALLRQPRGESVPASEADAALAPLMKFTAPFDFSGSPTISLPCGFNDGGLPLSLQLIGRHLDEATLCRAGHAYQQATDWHRRRPPLVS